MSEKFFQKQILKIHVEKSEKSKQVIQVMQWGTNKPALEKRGYYLKDGEWQCGKSLGINLADFKHILKMKNEIKEALAQEPEVPEENEDEDEDEKPVKKSKKKHKKHYEEDSDE